MFTLANPLRGFGPTTAAGDPPASPVITAVDNGDGTTTVTIASGSVGAFNTVYSSVIGSDTWVEEGTRTSNGTVSITLSDGRYFLYVLSALNDQQSVSNIVVLRVGTPAADLDHSPAHIVGRLLIDLGVGTLASASSSWPVYVDSEPDQPDSLIVCTNTSGVVHGRLHGSGEVPEHYGVQVKVRSPKPVTGYPKMNQIQKAIDETAYQDYVLIDSQQYFVHALTRRGGIIAAGKDVGKRNLYTLNVIVSLKKSS